MKPSSIHTAEIFNSPRPGLFGNRIESDRHFVKHSRATFGLGLIERGAQNSASGRGPVEACASDVISCNPGEVHDGHPVWSRSRRWRMVYAEPEVSAALAGAVSVQDVSRVELTRPVTSDVRSAHAVRSLFEALEDSRAWGDQRRCGPESLTCEEWFARASALLLCRPAKPIGRVDVPIEIRRAHEIIATDLLAPPSVTELALASGLSKYQLLRGFEASYGLPPQRWLRYCSIALRRAPGVNPISLVKCRVR